MARIVVAEDDEQISFLLEFRLEDAGHEVILVGNGEELLAELEREAADVLVLDVMMPRLDGLAALKQLREQGVQTPTIIVSALGRPENHAAAEKLGVVAYLTKPFDAEDLVVAVAAALA